MTTARIVDGAAHAFWVMRGSRILEVAACLVRVQGRVAFNTVTMIRNAALADLGLAYLPQDLVDAAIQEGQLVRCPRGLVFTSSRLSPLLSKPPPTLARIHAGGGCAAISLQVTAIDATPACGLLFPARAACLQRG